MKKSVTKILGPAMALTLAAALLPNVSAMATIGDSSDLPESTEEIGTVQLTFRAGDVGTFDTATAEKLERAGYDYDIEITENYISIETPRSATVAETLSRSFGTASADTLMGQIAKHDGYALLSAEEWKVDGEDEIRRNTEYVLDYGKLVDPVMYEVHFMDTDSYNEATGVYETEITAPVINYGNAGDMIEVTTPIVNEYATTTKEFSFKLNEGGPNTYYIYYAYTGTDYEENITYEDVYNYLTQDQIITITLPGNNNGNANAGNAGDNGGDANADNGADANEEVQIADNDTPLADGDEASSDESSTVIEDEEPPLDDGTSNETSIQYVIIGTLAALALAAGLIVFLNVRSRKKKAVNSKEEHKEN